MLAKEIEFPLFHLGTVPDSTGTPVTFTAELLREMARNSNFVTQSGILHAPIKYDHPAAGTPDKENHGKMVRYEFRGNSLFAVGTNWSDRVKADKAAEKRIAYSGEFVPKFSYPDPTTGKTVELGPTVVGLALLGSDRPAFKNLKPFSSFEFGEAISPVDAYETRQELRSAGLVSEYCDGTHFYAEVENDARRFSERQEQTMTDAEIQAAIAAGVKANIDAAVAAAIAPAVASAVKPLQDQIKSFSETSKRQGEVHAFCETVRTTKKTLNKLSLDRLEKNILLHEDMTPALDKEVRAFVEGLSEVILPGGMAGKKKDAGTDVDENGGEDEDEPPALAKVRSKHFSEVDDARSQQIVDEALTAFSEYKPDAFKGIESDPQAQIVKLQSYVKQRDTAAN